MNYHAKAFCLIIITILFAISVQAQTEEDLYEEYMQINVQLQQIQQQALADKKIESMNRQFSEKLESVIIKENPELETSIKKRNELIDKFEASRETASQEKLDELKTEFEMVAQELQTAQQNVIQRDEFKKELKDIEDAVINKMEEINPETPALFAKMNELGGKLQKMQKQE